MKQIGQWCTVRRFHNPECNQTGDSSSCVCDLDFLDRKPDEIWTFSGEPAGETPPTDGGKEVK